MERGKPRTLRAFGLSLPKNEVIIQSFNQAMTCRTCLFLPLIYNRPMQAAEGSPAQTMLPRGTGFRLCVLKGSPRATGL